MQKKILITGASGFIGGFMVEEALAQGYQVWAGVRKQANKEYLTDDRIHFIDLAYSEPDRLVEQLKEIKNRHHGWDYVVHNAGATKCKHPSQFEEVNYRYTKNLVDALVQTDSIPTLFIYMSSLSVWGPGDEEKYTPISVTDMPKPNTAYGVSKLMAEQYIQKKPSLPHLILRPTGVYGPREKDYFLIAKSVKLHLDFAAGYQTQRLTFVYVKDLVRVLFCAIDQKIVNKSYFVSDGKSYTSSSYANCAQKELGVRWLIRIKLPLSVLKVISLCAQFSASLFGKTSTLNGDKYKIMKQRNWLCNIKPLEDDLGFIPQYDLQKGVKESIDWYKKEKWI